MLKNVSVILLDEHQSLAFIAGGSDSQKAFAIISILIYTLEKVCSHLAAKRTKKNDFIFTQLANYLIKSSAKVLWIDLGVILKGTLLHFNEAWLNKNTNFRLQIKPIHHTWLT